MPSPNQTESAVAGKTSLGALFEAEEAPLLRYAYSLVGRRAIAEEVVQDVFLQLHHHWETVDNPQAWLYRSVRNRSYNHNRDHQKEILTDERPAKEKDQGETPDETLKRMEAAGYLRLTLAELSEEDRRLVELKYFQDMKYSEISQQTGLSVGNVGYKLHHILKHLADKLRQLGIDGTK